MMSTHKLVCQMKPYIQPFECNLALKELEALSCAAVAPQDDRSSWPTIYCTVSQHAADDLAARLAYWERVYPASQDPSRGSFTRQIRYEATTYLARNGAKPEQLGEQLPFGDEVPLPNRRNLRYGSHGIHEYRGKFFPQLVRSLLNVVGANDDSIVLDPMCGSGTTLVEAILLGCQAVGIDLNPLSVLMSRAKCGVLHADPDQLLSEYESLKTDLLAPSLFKDDGLAWFDRLPSKDRQYLSRWFAPQVLADLDPITKRVYDTTDPTCRILFQVVLSNILRSVSWQKDDDLRVRKTKDLTLVEDVTSIFLTELRRSVNMILAFLYENQGHQVGKARIIEGDIRRIEQESDDLEGQVDVIITSPPYATALPYLDTDRLSLCYLGLLSRTEHRCREHNMIGNREITNGQRHSYLEEYRHRKLELPIEIIDVIDRIEELNQNANVGFRRRNKAALLARYFFDMRKTFEGFQALLRPGAPAYVVVGNNYTIAGGQRIDIETDKLLARLSESIGMTLEETIPMEMLVSRDIFRKHTGSAETILAFRNTQS